jgi:AraC-like DNA-binding protein
MNAYLLREMRMHVERLTRSEPIRKVLPSLTVARSTHRSRLEHYISEPVLSVVLQGAKRVVLGDEALRYGAGQFLVVSVDMPLSGHITQASVSEPFLGLSYTLSSDLIAELVHDGDIRGDDETSRTGIAVSDLTDDFLNSLLRLVQLADRPEDVPVLGRALEREITWRLMHSDQGDMVRQIGLADSHMAQVGRAISWMRRNYAQTVSVGELAEMAGMSATSFHRHFRKVTQKSPIQFLQQVRLHEARARLLASTKNVSTIAYEAGYNNPSQFSREYKRLFGIPPRAEGRQQAAAGQ